MPSRKLWPEQPVDKARDSIQSLKTGPIAIANLIYLGKIVIGRESAMICPCMLL